MRPLFRSLFAFTQVLLVVAPVVGGVAYRSTPLGEVKLWQIGPNKVDATLLEVDLAVHCVAFSLDGKSVATGGVLGLLQFWDPATKNETGNLKMPLDHSIFALAYCPNNKQLLISSFCGSSSKVCVTILNLETQKTTVAFATPGHQRGLAIARNGRVVATWGGFGDEVPNGDNLRMRGTEPGVVMLWDLEARKELFRYVSSRVVHSAAISPDTRFLAAAVDEDSVKLWKIESGMEVMSIEGAGPIAFTPDGKRLAVHGGWKRKDTVALWDMERKEKASELRGFGGYVSHLAFSPDGKLLAVSVHSASASIRLQLWDVDAKKPIAMLDGHSASVAIESMAFSADGKLLATAASGSRHESRKPGPIESAASVAVAGWYSLSRRMRTVLTICAGVSLLVFVFIGSEKWYRFRRKRLK